MAQDGMDALLVSMARQDAVSASGYDWPDIHGVLDKIGEELGELREAARSGDSEHAGRELGDLLLAAVNAARFLRTDPALRLLEATERLEKRASAALALLREQGRDPASCTPCELDAAWRAVKTQEGKQLNERP
ncbi:MAG TPA: MazG nucleotide pyrophosphohydrolase domain-containing protein [Candidatus Hydrogenedentes bacterium]|nr:MazG nucleotide pyrophosphohydrolase domain-containing protein [Candidatus Hydrogenedentota bacterium]HOH51103.1 MazG nucleotide pyrophosphohydrolase domain-containing protein [Candidatus Hydrogenedentota bacterium]